MRGTGQVFETDGRNGSLLIRLVSGTIRKEDGIALDLSRTLFALDGRDSTEVAGDLRTYVAHKLFLTLLRISVRFRPVKARPRGA